MVGGKLRYGSKYLINACSFHSRKKWCFYTSETKDYELSKG